MLGLVIGLAVSLSPPPPVSRVVSSDEGLRLSAQPTVEWRRGTCNAASVEVFPDQRKQTIGGFGASMTESSAMNLNALPAAKQEELLALLYGPTGARLSAMKATMLANDFAAAGPWETYDDHAGDVSLDHFSIARDLRTDGSLTLIRRALGAAANSAMTIQAYMDFPPDWMLLGALPDNATVNPTMYDTLAQYYAKFLQAYAAHGVHIDFLEAFNEPFDSYTQMTATQLARFLGQHLGPHLEKQGLWPKTKLTYGGQCARASAAAFVPAVMSDPSARKYMDVIAYHGYDCQLAMRDNPKANCTDARQRYDAIAMLHEAYPSKALWMTEVCYAYNGDDPNCTSAATLQWCTDYPRDPTLAPPLPRRDFADGVTWGSRIAKELQVGASGWIYWNLLLDTTGGPFLLSPAHGDAGKNWQHPVVVVDPKAGEFDPTGLFYFLAHFGRYVRPGAVRLETKVAMDEQVRTRGGDGVVAVAFDVLAASEDHTQTATEKGATVESGLNYPSLPKGTSKVVQLVHGGNETMDVQLCSEGWVATLPLPPRSITTAAW